MDIIKVYIFLLLSSMFTDVLLRRYNLWEKVIFERSKHKQVFIGENNVFAVKVYNINSARFKFIRFYNFSFSGASDFPLLHAVSKYDAPPRNKRS